MVFVLGFSSISPVVLFTISDKISFEFFLKFSFLEKFRRRLLAVESIPFISQDYDSELYRYFLSILSFCFLLQIKRDACDY